MRIALLTGGGDCPGLNAAIRSVVRRSCAIHDDDVIGFHNAWQGVMGLDYERLTRDSVYGILARGGTILGTTRGSPYDYEDGPEIARNNLEQLGIDALIVIGGNGSLTVASKLARDVGINVIGIPKTIDNDIVGTDLTFGFHTAVQTATDAIDRLQTTAESHNRVMVVEVMGRDTGWIALQAGIAGGATSILIPEIPFDIEAVCNQVGARHKRGRYASIVVVAEGATPRDGTLPEIQYEVDAIGRPKFGGIVNLIAPEIERRTGYEVRVVQIGHVQRGGTPTAYDRVLATRFGAAAVDAAHDHNFGMMTALTGTDITLVPISVTEGKTKQVDLDYFGDLNESFCG
jgi:6-phosphofructokinase 1